MDEGRALSQKEIDDLLGFTRERRSRWAKLTALNLPPLATLAASAHAGYLDGLVADPLLGAWCGGIGLAFAWSVLALAIGRDDLSRWIGARLTLLGMLGTLYGFVVAFAAVSMAGDLQATKAAIGTLTQGLSVAIYTTIVGLVCKMMLDVQMRWAR